MKKLISLIFIVTAFTMASQPKKAAKMAPITTPGYYLSAKGDTVKGEVRTNPDDELDFYKGFSFKPAKGGKLVEIDIKKAKAYAFENKQFEKINNNGDDVYAEVLSKGRLNFYEIRFMGKIDGYEAIESSYFIQDNNAEGDDLKLREPKKLNDKFNYKFFKKGLAPYMKDQKIIWDNLNEYPFNKQAVVEAINEFNKLYLIAKPE
jgi:hypothetical protein